MGICYSPFVYETDIQKQLSQIQRRRYAAPYRASGKPVWAVALSFNGRTRQFKGGAALPVK